MLSFIYYLSRIEDLHTLYDLARRGLNTSVNLRMLISRFFMSLGLTSWKCQTLSVKEDKLPQEFIARCWAAHGLFRKARASGFESGREGRKTVLLEAPPKPP